MDTVFSRLQQQALAETPQIPHGDIRNHPVVTDFAYRLIRTLDLDVALVEVLRREGSSAPFPEDAQGKIIHIESFLELAPFDGNQADLRSEKRTIH